MGSDRERFRGVLGWWHAGCLLQFVQLTAWTIGFSSF